MWPCSTAPSLLELWVPSTDYPMGPTLSTFLKLRGGQTHTHRDAHTHQTWNSSTYSFVTLTLPCCPLTMSLTFSSWPSPNKAIESLQLLSAFSRVLTLFSGFSFSDTFFFFSDSCSSLLAPRKLKSQKERQHSRKCIKNGQPGISFFKCEEKKRVRPEELAWGERNIRCYIWQMLLS